MLKFGRNYILTIQVQPTATVSGSGALGTIPADNLLVIQPPFTIEFDITRNIAHAANVAQIRIYNLSKDNRNNLRFNIMNIFQYRGIQLQAGYGTNLPIIFKGNISQAYSIREGDNFITTIECYDGGFAFNTGVTNTTFPGPTTQGGANGTPLKTVITNLASSLPNVAVGAIGNFYTGNVARGMALNGSTTDILKDLSGGGFFIDNETVNCLGDSECLEGEMALINSQSGLLGTPQLELNNLTFDVEFEPRLVPGQLLQLQSSTDANFNGFYKVNSVKHRGMISEAVCGDVTTSVGMFSGIGALSTVGALE